MKSSTIIILILFGITLIPSNLFEFNLNKKTIPDFDRPKNEGYVAFIINEKLLNYKPDNPSPPQPSECECGGSEVIVHGDGHRTPCPCVAGGGKCECAKKQVSENPQNEDLKKK